MVDAPSVTPKPRRPPEWKVEVKERSTWGTVWFNVRVTHVPTGITYNGEAYPNNVRNAVPKRIRELKRRIRKDLKTKAKIDKIKKKYGGTQ